MIEYGPRAWAANLVGQVTLTLTLTLSLTPTHSPPHPHRTLTLTLTLTPTRFDPDEAECRELVHALSVSHV